jgi:hypothetical protein
MQDEEKQNKNTMLCLGHHYKQTQINSLANALLASSQINGLLWSLVNQWIVSKL